MSFFVLPILMLTVSINVSFSELITTAGEERADFSAIDYSRNLWFLFGVSSFPSWC